ncbi:hypothetical protein ElyMa_000845100 [Elysia marginata]|uniref:Uncharacterized protein n=1 Tax=Elysia marginata TaxID=1093978 RepID=A0AAV4H2F0_9GAST|nr:hypothetical protein ElyMa_000845100 [Elysia marginata]
MPRRERSASQTAQASTMDYTSIESSKAEAAPGRASMEEAGDPSAETSTSTTERTQKVFLLQKRVYIFKLNTVVLSSGSSKEQILYQDNSM